MRSGLALMLLCGLASGCDQLFAIIRVDEPPVDAASDAAPPCIARDVSAGQFHACAIDAQGDVYCWGSNRYGQVQPGGPFHVLTPTKVPLPAAATEVELGKSSTCVRIEGDVYCWGDNDAGELGMGPNDRTNSVRKIAGIPASAQIAAGGGHVCSRSAADGTIWCWGRSRQGQTGQSSSLTCQGNPCTLPLAVPNITGAKHLAAGHNATCAIDSSDQLFCWGRNNLGQLGLGNTADTPTPTLVPLAPPIRSVDLAGRFTCVIDGMQRTWCMGEGEDGQIGNGGFQPTTTPVQVFVTKPTQIATNGFGVCAVTEENALSCWGTMDPGDGKVGTYATPHVSDVPDVTKLTGHFYSYCAISNGGVLCWGDNMDGQLGRGARGIHLSPQVLDLATASTLAVGQGHGCAIVGGQVRCWGENEFGETGDTASLARKHVPTPVDVPITSPTYLAAAFYKSCAWGNGEAACWGKGYAGHLGSGTSSRALAPTKVLKTSIRNGPKSVAIGAAHLCAIDTNLTLTCYGNNANGQLGNNSMANSMAGVLAGITSVDQVVAGLIHTCARKSIGEVWCWGGNHIGQLGDGTTTQRLSPINVNGLGTVAHIGAGEDHTCALTTAGEVWCWGRNNNGQIGNGTTSATLTPARVVTTGATDLVVGATQTCAKVGSDWWCWGRNDRGQLANGLQTDVLVPTPVPNFGNAMSVAVSNSAGCKLAADGVSCTGVIATLGIGDNSESFPRAPLLPSCQ